MSVFVCLNFLDWLFLLASPKHLLFSPSKRQQKQNHHLCHSNSEVALLQHRVCLCGRGLFLGGRNDFIWRAKCLRVRIRNEAKTIDG